LIPPRLPASKKWRKALEKDFGFTCISSQNEIVDPYSVLWTTSCSKTKQKKVGTPKEFYRGRYHNSFYEYVEKNKLTYGILSDKYGIHMFDEELEYYDIHPHELTMEKKEELGNLLRKKAKKYGFEEILFYYPSPLMSKPYFEILWFSRLKVYYTTKLSLTREIEP